MLYHGDVTVRLSQPEIGLKPGDTMLPWDRPARSGGWQGAVERGLDNPRRPQVPTGHVFSTTGGALVPRITSDRVGVAVDLQGCPNRCRHCWLGSASGRRLSEDDLRWAAGEFRRYVDAGESTVGRMSVASWFREPDFSDDYRRLYDVEAELSDGKPERYELLSIWRLARDPEYALWSRSVGPDTCQISFFGLEETNDWFYRRKGAFGDALKATARLLQVGMKPRWQLFLTRKLLPEIDDLLALIDRLELPRRVRALGAEFQLFIHPPGPNYEARRIEYLRPLLAETTDLPERILRSSRTHFGRDVLWQTEADLYAGIVEDSDSSAAEGAGPDALWFLVKSNWDVYPNIGTLEEWWKLGNLKRDPVATIIRRFERDESVGQQALFHHSARELTESYGDPVGTKVYSGRGDLLSLYRARHCETIFGRLDSRGPP